ncbi:MAG TPA: PP2C family protein-serine/threonine phosphatase [Anaerolineales bacterium]|nr:PP2C family protein-serine/threonine phosphatase [Anaerolineales bacterium]
MEVVVGIAKVQKYASSESGDTVEVVERPNGGLSIVLADGQSSGKGAKWISTLVVRKVISLLAEGVRDGAAARAASDSLFTERNGKVSATLNILSVDNQTRTLVITRNNPAAVLLAQNEAEVKCLDDPCLPIGLYRDTRPMISEVPLQAGLTAVMFTDGIVHAGSRYGESMDVPTSLQALLEEEDPSAQMMADALLGHALKLDRDRPTDDISVVVLRVMSYTGDFVRRMTVRMPIAS